MKFKSKAALTRWTLEARHVWFFLDYDGTLSDFAPTPEHIEPDAEIIYLVKGLAQKSNFRVTILSGRRLSHVRMLLPVAGIFLAGTYGIELLTPSGETIQRVKYEVIRPTLETIKPRWEEILRGRSGFFLEDKGWTLALHGRFADDREAEEVLTQAGQMIGQEALQDRFRILGGHKFLEIAPRLASKRETVKHLLEQYPFPEARLVYIGDDDKDEEAFPLIHAQQGVAIKVWQPSQAEHRTEADFLFQSSGEARQWLEELIPTP